MDTPAVKVLREPHVAILAREQRAVQIAPPGQVVLKVVLAKGQDVTLALVAQMLALRVLVDRVQRGVPMRGRQERPQQANRLIRMGNPVCGQKVARVGRIRQAAQALDRAVPRPVAQAVHRAAVALASRALDAHRRVLATAIQTALESHAHRRAVMTGSPKVRQRMSRAWVSQNPREAIARRMLNGGQGVAESSLSG
jgi:hypothetical protein